MAIYYKANSTWQNMALDFYPIGSFYQSLSNISPAEVFGGNWNEIFTDDIYTSYEGLVCNNNNIVTYQKWDDIIATGEIRSGVVKIRIYRPPNASSARLNPQPDSGSIMATIDSDWAPVTDFSTTIGYLNDGSWVTVSIDADGNIRVWARYCPNEYATVSQFDGTIVYPLKSLNSSNTNVRIWQRIS